MSTVKVLNEFNCTDYVNNITAKIFKQKEV